MSEWISVEDRLPKEYQRVLCVMRDSSNPDAQIQIIKWWCFDQVEFSHWMPLPEPPE
jgi:hypothetical protein